MQIKLAKTAGFCFGVNRAVNLVYDLVNQGEKVSTFGPIIHNKQVVQDLEKKGVKSIDNPSKCQQGYKIIIRTHGVEKSIVDEIEKNNIPYVNATCPFVLKIHKIVREQEDGTITLIAGNEKHPEVMGIRSFCKGESYVFQNEKELEKLITDKALC